MVTEASVGIDISEGGIDADRVALIVTLLQQYNVRISKT